MLAKTLSALAVTGLLAAAGPAHAQQAPQQLQTFLWNETAPQNGGRGEVVSPNSQPPGFTDGTEQGLHAQTVARWFAAQGYKNPQPTGY